MVNGDDGDGIAPDPLVWYAGVLLKRRRVGWEERGRAMLPGLASLWRSGWIHLPCTAVTAEDVGAWPYSGLMVKCFFGSLYWPILELVLYFPTKFLTISMCFSECVFFQMKINNHFWKVTVFPRKSDIFHWT